jgi:integrase
VTKTSKPAKAFLVWDTKAPNLALRTQPTGFKSWTVIYPYHGRSRWLTLGPANAIPLEEARVMAAEAMLKVHKGGDPAADRKAERGSGTFAELHERYVTEYAKQQNKSWRQADALIKKNVLPRLGKLSAPTVTRDDIKKLLAKIAETAPIMANQVLASTSAVFSWATKEGIVTNNPCRLITRYPTKDRERILATSEVPLFWSAFGELDPVRGAALKAILLLGQRPGEVSAMRAEHIRDGWWEMPGAPIPGIWPGTKNGESHRVWIPAAARDLLAAMPNGNGSGFVFASPRGGPITGLDAAMRSICAKLKIEPPVRPHDLRRSHGSTITALGFGRDAMNRIQNHKEGGVTDIYDRHGYETENKRVMEAVAAKIMALVEGHASDKVVKFTR